MVTCNWQSRRVAQRQRKAESTELGNLEGYAGPPIFPLKVLGNLLVHFKAFHHFALHWSSQQKCAPPPFDPGP